MLVYFQFLFAIKRDWNTLLTKKDASFKKLILELQNNISDLNDKIKNKIIT